ncbi:pentatricopeptide repeat protein [Histoplasma capsulatum G186AR]|uniref:Pentatricopeptide repeat protein n=2 Tax=Ajellomyces capsulatus TaxID=5037 RepID=C0NNS6_AJECG|nr:pentatricopeptide repeat protein [Histoplasma capsulatum G186AR]EEH06586.1 pentatricopeptide repeat protein [Histoplasma capsulatum G186AR]KAG5304885.1 pentatricopeptide repeat protein [Histoplasma capsulatum]QSS75844.1 pentatricopeptide repeat protein [Histoplasma capsulatum G186AR]
MRRLSLSRAQWHRHGVHQSHFSLPFPPHPHTQRHLSNSTAHSNGDGRNNNPKASIRWFEQPTRWSKEKVEVYPEEEEQAEQDVIWAKIRELQEELKEIKQGPFGPHSPLMKQLSEKQREIVRDAVRKYEEEHVEEEAKDNQRYQDFFAGLDEMIAEETQDLEKQKTAEWNPKEMLEASKPPHKESFEVELKVPDTAQAHVNRFNQNLKVLIKDPTRGHRQELWRSYQRCKALIPAFVELLPEETLTILWNSQSQSASLQTPQLGHWEDFAEDILSNGRDLTQPQWLRYITLLLDNGQSNKALSLWKSRENHLHYGSKMEVEQFWKLGVDILIANGELESAQDIALAFLADDACRPPRILIPIIVAWAKIPGNTNGARAWTLYLRLKTILGSDINMNDYDSISIGFLKAGRVDMAVAVFKDMMLSGQTSPSDSTSLYRASLGLVGNLQASSITEADVNKVSLYALTIMPRKFQNKFFYASWMKKLIGMGEIDSAAAVVELMYERGINPDAKHLNGVISGWLRKDSVDSRDKAAKLGWAMIQERIDTVWSRQKSPSPESSKPSVHDANDGIRIPKFEHKTVPPASIETFSLLLLYYTRRGQEHLANYVIECLEKAQMRPNAFFMNHLLFAELRKQDVLGVWTRYQQMSATVRPDLETFACLWDCAKIQYDRARPSFDSNFPTARVLYREMMDWYFSLSPRSQANVRKLFTKDLYDQILRCFSFSLDPQGTIVALHSLRHVFGYIPDIVTARILMFEVVRLLPAPLELEDKKKARHHRRRISTNPRSKESLQHVTKLLETLRDRKVVELGKQGLLIEDLDMKSRKDHEVNLYTDLLRVVLSRLAENPRKNEDKIRKAALDMGESEELYLGEPVPAELLP